MLLTAEFFFDLEHRLRELGLDSDSENFDIIKARLGRKEPLSPDDFARQAIYVILAGGFSQKTAKIIHGKVMDYLVGAWSARPNDMGALTAPLLAIFHNQNKINAVVKIWLDRKKYRDDYYALKDGDLETKLSYLSKLPHIGKITANHLARNLGEDVVKYDIWIQRLGCAFAEQNNVGANVNSPDATINIRANLHSPLRDKIDNGNLDPEIKSACDKMFAHLAGATGLPRGYIDIVLWKGLQNHMIQGV